MLYIVGLILFLLRINVHSLSWNTTENILPWESYLQLGDIQRPLGLTLNSSSIAHRHFYIGYLCLHSFLYDEARDAFDLAINKTPTLIEAYIGKMLGCKHALWSYTDRTCGQSVYRAAQTMLNISNITLSSLQSSLLSTAYLWYTNQTNTTAGEVTFLSSIGNLSLMYPNETDIRVLWGLSLLNVADQAQFQSQMEPAYMITARERLREVLNMEPNHPGLLHYLIHAYDVVKVDVAEQAREYALLYGKIVLTASHAQHMPAHIWMRTGSWNLASTADGNCIRVGLELCARKLLNENISISSIDLNGIFSVINTTQIPLLLQCDAENRAHSFEWLSYTRLQIGNWLGVLPLLRDLFIADKLSLIRPNYYLSAAYRTQARTIIELFFWFYNDNRFSDKVQQILALNGTQTIVSTGDNMTEYYPMWSEAGLRFSECLRLLLMNNSNNITSMMNNHLDRLVVLSNRTSTVNQYASTVISIMTSQIRGIQFCLNQSWQDCLSTLNDAAQREAMLVLDTTSPTLIYARSSELLAMHLLLIHEKYLQQSTRVLSSNYILNGTNVSIHDFPSRALAWYQKANSSAPHRAINTIGIARAQTQLHNYTEATRLYRILKTQITSSNNTDLIFAEEINTSLTEIEQNHNSANTNKQFFLTIIFICFLIFF